MKSKLSKSSIIWVLLFLCAPVLFFIFQFLPYYHAGGGPLPSLAAYFWLPETQEQATEFLALFYQNFRSNDLITALLGTQFTAVIIMIMILILKDRAVTATALGCWGIFGLYIFLTTRSLTFSPVLVYGGIASLLMLLSFLIAVVVSAVYLFLVYRKYKNNLSILKTEQINDPA